MIFLVYECILVLEQLKYTMDVYSATKRSELMAKVRSKDTKPERALRSCLHRLGFRFRMQRRNLPGTPDIILPKFHTVIFVHGCFWHRHTGCKRATMPQDNFEYWTKKFESNVRRDAMNQQALRKLGWKVLIVWECEIKNILQNPDVIKRRILEEEDE